MNQIRSTGAGVVAAANPGCLQLVNASKKSGCAIEVAHPLFLLAKAYRQKPQK